MFIHIGNDHVIQSDQIISIVERNIIESSSMMEEMMQHLEKASNVYGSLEDAKSVVITSEHAYYSSLSPATLTKRANMTSTIAKLEDYSDEIET